MIMRRKIIEVPGIYIIRSIKTSRMYVGSSNNIKRRYYEHISDLNLKRHANVFLQRHVNKYGVEDLEFFIVEIIRDQFQLIPREQYWMDCLHPMFNGIKPSATRLGIPVSEETRKKLSIIHTERMKDPAIREHLRACALKQFANPDNRKYLSDLMKARIKEKGNYMQGRFHSEETKQKISETKKANGSSGGSRNPMYGRKHSKETKQKIREAVGDQSGTNNGMYGKHHSEATKQKIRESRKNLSAESRKRMSEAQKRRFAKMKEAYKLPEVK